MAAGTRDAMKLGTATSANAAASTSAKIWIGRAPVADLRERKPRDLAQVPVDDELPVDADRRAGQAARREHQRRFDREDQPHRDPASPPRGAGPPVERGAATARGERGGHRAIAASSSSVEISELLAEAFTREPVRSRFRVCGERTPRPLRGPRASDDRGTRRHSGCAPCAKLAASAVGAVCSPTLGPVVTELMKITPGGHARLVVVAAIRKLTFPVGGQVSAPPTPAWWASAICC